MFPTALSLTPATKLEESYFQAETLTTLDPDTKKSQTPLPPDAEVRQLFRGSNPWRLQLSSLISSPSVALQVNAW